MATPFATYYDKALANYAPARQEAMKSATASLADRGLGNSTAAVGKLASIGNQYDASARTAAEQSRQYDVSAANQERATALQWYDAIQNYNLARQQLQPKWKKAAWAKVPSWFKSYQNNNALASQIGDGKGKVVSAPNYDVTDVGGGGDTAQYMSLKNAQSNAEASLGLERQRLSESIRQYNETKALNAAKLAADNKPVDPWTMLGQAINEMTADTDPNTPGTQVQKLPSTNIALLGTAGIDLVGAARNEADPNHKKALDALKALYPGGTWTKLLADGETSAPAAPEGAGMTWMNSHIQPTRLESATNAVQNAAPSQSLFGGKLGSFSALADSNPVGWAAAYSKPTLQSLWNWINSRPS